MDADAGSFARAEHVQESRAILAKTIQEEIDAEMLLAAEVDDDDEVNDAEAYAAWKVPRLP